MAKNLVIVESPKKTGTYKKVLGSDYNVLATYGHCVDLPEKKLGINIKKGFTPTWEVKEDKSSVLAALKRAAKTASEIYLMTDCDREGEAIAWHIYDQIKDTTKASVYRATTNEITKKGILSAISNRGQIDEQKINAYLARRLLDRLCGYKTSYLTHQATGGRSAGRVQSAILRIIVEREKEIEAFRPEEYWVLTGNFITPRGDAYEGVLTDKIKISNEETATKIYNEIIGGSPVVESVESKEVNINPFSPFTTSLMIQSASTILGWNAKKIMKVAQSLYENGHITYMRTDSSFIAEEAIDQIREYIDDSYGQSYLPSSPRFFKSRKGAQEAHECCRAVNISATPHLQGEECSLYEMIWKRTVSCQMKPGIDRRTKAITKVAGYDFHSHGNVIIFDGFRRVWTYGKSLGSLLPRIEKGDKCTLKSLVKEQKFTSPPPRFTDASLQKRCEAEQISRPATFANFLETLKNRKYVTQSKKSFTSPE